MASPYLIHVTQQWTCFLICEIQTFALMNSDSCDVKEQIEVYYKNAIVIKNMYFYWDCLNVHVNWRGFRVKKDANICIYKLQFSNILNLSHSCGCEMVFVILICITLLTNEDRNFFVDLLAIHLSSSVSIHSSPLSIFNWVVSFYYWFVVLHIF